MPVARLVPTIETPAEPVIRTLLLTDLVGSTRMVEKLGDTRAYEVAAQHDRAARDLLPRFHGLEIDKTDGFLLLFERPIDAVGYALAYHQTLSELSRVLGVALQARAGIHLGEVLLRENSPADVALGAKRLEVEGIAKPTTARVMSLARGNQTLLTHSAFDLARRSTVGAQLPSRPISWLAHGCYLFQGIDEPIEIFEAGAPGLAPLSSPPDSEKARRNVPAGDEITLGWRPAPDQKIPLRPNWTLIERLGAGGFGEVWLASHKKTSEKRVFKFCYEARRLRSLQREATLFRLLKETLGQRDGIARILDWNFDQAPYFLESEYTEGGSLIEWAKAQGGLDKVPLATRLELIAQAAEALAAAHSVGVLHKDVKPSNVLVRPGQDGAPKARLTDFGIGRVMDASVLAEQGITELGLTEALPGVAGASTAGTQLYMAPELLEGKAATIEADIYALGVMLYQMVVGDFSHALAPGWRRDVPDKILVQDVAQMVDGSPERRPSSAQAAAGRLRRLEERRAEAKARETRERTHRRWKLFASFGALATVVLLIVSILAVQALQARREADLRRSQAENLIGFMLGDLQKKLKLVGRLDILNDVGDKALDYFAAVPEENLTDDEIFRHSKALKQIGQVRRDEGDVEAAMEVFHRSLALVERLTARDGQNAQWQKELGDRHFWIGSLLWNQGELNGALERFRNQLAVAQGLIEKDPANLDWQLNAAHANTNIGFVQKARGNLEAALRAFRSTLETKHMLLDREPEETKKQLSLADQYNLVGWVLMELGEMGAALENFSADQRIAEALVAKDPTNTIWQLQLAQSHNYVGRVLHITGDREGARENFRAYLRIAKSLVEIDPTHTDWQHHLANAHRWVGIDLEVRGKLHDALKEARQGLQILTRLTRMNPANVEWQRDLATAHLSVGDVLELLGEAEGAREKAESALALLEPLIENNPKDPQIHSRLSESYVLLARALTDLAAPKAARSAWQRAAEIIEPFARDSRDIMLLEPWAKALSHLGRTTESEPIRQKLQSIKAPIIKRNGAASMEASQNATVRATKRREVQSIEGSAVTTRAYIRTPFINLFRFIGASSVQHSQYQLP